jgi:adenylate kinase family enzyme
MEGTKLTYSEADKELIEQLNSQVWMPDIPELAPSGKAWMSRSEHLKANICKVFKHIRKNYFYILIIEGPPGSGKTTIGAQIGNDVDPNFCIENICIDNKEFSNRLARIEKHSEIMYDEGTLGLFSRDAMNIANRVLNKAIMIGRAKIQGVIVICIPNFLALDTNIRENLVNGLIRIKKRGVFEFFTGKTARIIGHNKTYQNMKPIFRGDFSAEMPFKEEYEKKKLAGVGKFLKQSVTQGMLTPGQVAAQIGCSSQKVLKALKLGLVPYETMNSAEGKQSRYLIKPSYAYILKQKLEPKRRGKED